MVVKWTNYPKENFLTKMTGVLVVPFWRKKCGFVLLMILRPNSWQSCCSTFKVINLKNEWNCRTIWQACKKPLLMNYKMPAISQFRTGSSKGSNFFSLHPQNKILLPLRVVKKKKTLPEQTASSCLDSHGFNDCNGFFFSNLFYNNTQIP